MNRAHPSPATFAVVALPAGAGGRLVPAGLVLGAVALLTYAALDRARREEPTMVKLLRPYAWDGEGGPPPASPVLAQTTLVRRAVTFLAGFAERARLLPRIAAQLEEADIQLEPAEALFFALSGAALLSAFVFFATRSAVAAAVALVAAAVAPPAAVKFHIARRRRALQGQLPDVLRMLAGALRSGYSLQQALQTVAAEAVEPARRELGRAVAEARLGLPVDAALAVAGRYTRSKDWDFAVSAVRIQKEVGGNLADLLTRVADTMLARERLRRDVRAMTAEGRISAMVLGLLPVAMGVVMDVTNPEFMRALFESGDGRLMLAVSGVLAVAGFAWIKKTVTIEL